MGIPTPEILGGNCIYQAKLLADKIRQERKGIDVNYCNDGIHYNVLVKSSSGKIFYLDPYLMHSEVIVIPESSGREGIEAYPYQYGKVSVVSFERKDTKFLVEKFEALAGGYGRVGKYTYNFDALKTDNDLPSLADETIAFNYQKTSLYMRILLENKQALGYSYNINSERAYINDYDHNDVDIENKQEFEALLSIILDTLKIGRGDFMRYIEDGIRAYTLLLGRGNSRIGNSSPVFEGQCGGDTRRLEEIKRKQDEILSRYAYIIHHPLEWYIKNELPDALQSLKVILGIYRATSKPLIIFQNLTLGKFYPPFNGALKKGLGIYEIKADSLKNQLPQPQKEEIKGRKLILIAFRVSSKAVNQIFVDERIIEFLASLADLAKQIHGNIVMIDHAKNKGLTSAHHLWEMRYKGKSIVLNQESNFEIGESAAGEGGVTLFLLNPSLKLSRKRSCLDDRHILTAENNIAFFTDGGEQTTLHYYFLDLFVKSLYTTIRLENNKLKIDEFRDDSSSPLQSLDSQYKKAEAIATYYVREIYGFMMQILLLGKKRVKVSRQIVGLDERISKARKDSAREKYRQEIIRAEQKLRDVYSKIDALAAEASEEVEGFIMPKKLTSEDYFGQAKEHLANFLSVLKQEGAYNEPAAFLAGVGAINDLIAALTELALLRLERPREGSYFIQTRHGYKVRWGGHKKYRVSDKKSVPMRMARWHSFDTIWEAVQAVYRQFDSQLNEREWLVEAVESINAMRETFKKDTISQKDLSDIGDTIAGMLRKNKNAPIVTKKSIYRMALQAAREALAIDTKAADDALYICRKFMQARIKDIDDMMKRTEEGRLFHIRENVAQRNENISELLTQAIPIINARGELTQRQIDAVRRIIDTLLTDFQIAPFIRKEPDFYPLD